MTVKKNPAIGVYKVIDTFPNGNKQTEYEYSNEKDTSNYIVKKFYNTGELYFTTEVKDFKMVNKRVFYYTDGKIQYEELLKYPISLSDTNYDCETIKYRENGIIKSNCIYKGDTTIEKLFDSTGKLDSVINYYRGKLNGEVVGYYPSGKIKSIIKNTNGYYDGVEYDFLENGDTLKVINDYARIGEVRYKKWLSSGLTLTMKYGDKKKDYVIWEWINKNGQSVKKITDKGKPAKDGGIDFIAPE
jgi:antitoxin component YwqK of YwqJK toxin-antitoxin module